MKRTSITTAERKLGVTCLVVSTGLGDATHCRGNHQGGGSNPPGAVCEKGRRLNTMGGGSYIFTVGDKEKNIS